MDQAVHFREKLTNEASTAFHSEYAQMQRAIKYFESQIAEAIADPRLSAESVKFLKRTWSSPVEGDPMTMAQKRCREALTQAALLTLLHYAQSDPSAVVGARRLRLMSTCPSGGYTDYCGGKLRVAGVKAHFERAMTRRSLEGGLFLQSSFHSRRAVHAGSDGKRLHQRAYTKGTGSAFVRRRLNIR